MATIRCGLVVLVMVLAVPSSGRATEFDRTLPAAPGMRLDVRLYGGEVVVRAWDQDAVRVRAIHFPTDVIECTAIGTEIRVRARTTAGSLHGIDLDIDVPAWMAIGIVGPYVDVAANGTQSGVTIETIRGDIRVGGGNGTILLSSMEGQIALENARGTARLRAANNGVRVSGFAGDLQAETVDGSVRLRGVVASRVEVSTMTGDILWEGPLAEDGRSQLISHSGDIDVTLPPSASATIAVHGLDGNLRCQFAAPAGRGADGGRLLVLGSGRSRLDLESFNGIISIRQSVR
ncbi:MAG: DUF4097 family beta strand repeat-containing protein [Acidobacteriota bacterium]